MRYLSVISVVLLLVATSVRAQFTFDAGETGSHLLVSPPLPQFPPPPKVPPPGPVSNSAFVIQLVPLDGQEPNQILIFSCKVPSSAPAGINSFLPAPPRMTVLQQNGHFNDLHNRYQLSLWITNDCSSNNYAPAQFLGTDVVTGISTVFKFRGNDPTNPNAIIEIGVTDGSSGGGLTAAGLIDCNGEQGTLKKMRKN